MRDALLDITPKLLPNLRRLSVSIMWGVPGWSPAGDGDDVRRIMNEIVLPVDGMVRQFGPQLRECNIILYARLWGAIEKGGLREGVKHEVGDGRSVGNRYGRPLLWGLEDEGERDGPEGYWIIEGLDETY